MANRAGIWIDYQHAIVAVTSAQSQEIEKFNSGIDVPVRLLELGSDTSHERIGQKKLGRDATRQLHKFFDAIIASLSGCDKIIIMGPGNAKTEFIKYLERMKLQGLSVQIETAARTRLVPARGSKVDAAGKNRTASRYPKGRRTPA